MGRGRGRGKGVERKESVYPKVSKRSLQVLPVWWGLCVDRSARARTL